MNYKKIIRSRTLRLKILSWLNWIPDKIMIPIQYRIHTGRKLNLKHPKRFTEKLQVYKLKYRNPLMLRCTDKYEVRSVIEEAGLKDILIPLVGVYDNAVKIDFETLPNQFVAKTTDGGGGNQVLICHNKNDLGAKNFYDRINQWFKAPKGKNAGREWAYENKYPRRVIIEKLITDGVSKDLPDYKFYCFNGVPKYCQVIKNRSENELIDFFDMDWNLMPFCGLNPACKNSAEVIPKPENFEEMKHCASELSKNYPFVRVDLYINNAHIYFGELTFYPASGFGHFTPDLWDERLGELLSIPGSNLIKQNRVSVFFGGGKSLTISAFIQRSLIDYKFFCFGGKVKMIYVITDRDIGLNAKLGIYNTDFKKLDVCRNDELASNVVMQKPENFEEMINIAEKLAIFPHVRVDLYNVKGKIYFGELTFYDGSGYMSYSPDSFDFELGKYFDIDNL